VEALSEELTLRLRPTQNHVPLSDPRPPPPPAGPPHAMVTEHTSHGPIQAAAESKRQPRTESRPINKHAPQLTLPGYYTIPSMRRLQRLSDTGLRDVPQFLIGRDGVGEISFLYPGKL